MARRPRRQQALDDAERVLDADDASLLDVVDNVLSKGVVLTGDLTIALAQVDLIYARLSLLLCAADRVLPTENPEVIQRHRGRHQRRLRAQRAADGRPARRGDRRRRA